MLFWVFLLSGLTARYVLRRQLLSTGLLVAVPLVDLILLVASILDLRAGGVATVAHSLAAIYLGVSVGFGHRIITWADARFAHRFANGPVPTPKPRFGQSRAIYERRGWYHHLLAWGLGVGPMMLAVWWIGEPSRTAQFLATARIWTVVLVIDAIGSFSYTALPRTSPERPATLDQ
ncbi:hypothetical protein [Cryobacterium fucosi]|uniref:2TM domain-containing protein n=1 Tax=Cryobacterium fucosi TaxID=1259157 RepID=A0A4R9B0B0_9MICO|nr:hypothetical protein [Cryobacterium fucosi]TFD72842.1 hypothetical protein E3T48_15090 [Cryobacterium fucosi]